MKASFNMVTAEILLEPISSPPPNWSIVLSNGKYFAIVFYNGTGHSFFEHPTLNSITKWAPKINSQLGRFVYVNDAKTNEMWCINLPLIYKFDLWRVRFQTSYLKIETIKNQISVEVTYFVPNDKDLEYWLVRIKNESGHKKNLKIFSAVELSLGNLQSAILTPHTHELFLRTWIKDKVLYATKTLWDKIIFFSADPLPEFFDTLKSAFVGDGTIESPQAVREGWCYESIANGRESIFAFQHDVQLENTEEKEILIKLGVLNERTSPEAKIETAKIDFQKSIKFYENELFDKGLKIETPDKTLNQFINRWNKYQNWIYFHWQGYPNDNCDFELVRYKDALQSIVGILPLNQSICRERLLSLFKLQFENGNTCHKFNPHTNSATASNQAEDPLWLCTVTLEYLKETGDFEILKETLPYYDSEKEEPIHKHIEKAINFVLKLRGSYNLVLASHAHGQESTINLHERSVNEESTVETFILLYVMNEWARLNKFLKTDAKKYKSEIENLKSTLNQVAYEEYKKLDNAGWFIKGIIGDEKLGSYFSKEGKIFLEPQIWAVISNACDDERKIKCIKSSVDLLESAYGFLSFDPAYTEKNDKLGQINKLVAGEKENASFSIQTNALLIMALSTLTAEFREKAFEIYQKLMPLKFLNDKRYKAEPFVYPQYICGKDSPHFGEASFTWFTSSSAWMFKSFYEHICGIKPDYDGIHISKPIFPHNWDKVLVKRVFRGCSYNFKFIRKNEFCIILDGKKLSENFISTCGCRETHEVEIFF